MNKIIETTLTIIGLPFLAVGFLAAFIVDALRAGYDYYKTNL
jgi:hypothetical protein